MLNQKKYNKMALATIGILSLGIILCLLGYKPVGTNKKIVESSKICEKLIIGNHTRKAKTKINFITTILDINSLSGF